MSKTFRFQDLAKEAQGGDDLPEGKYNFVVEKTNTGETAANDPKIGLFVRVVDGPAEGQTQWLNFTFGENAAPVSARQLQQAGVSLPEEGGVEALASAAQGVRFTAEIVHKKVKERTYVNLKNISPAGSGIAAEAPAAPAPSPTPTPPAAEGGPGF